MDKRQVCVNCGSSLELTDFKCKYCGKLYKITREGTFTIIAFEYRTTNTKGLFVDLTEGEKTFIKRNRGKTLKKIDGVWNLVTIEKER